MTHTHPLLPSPRVYTRTDKDKQPQESVTCLSRILQPVEQHRSEKRSVLWHLPCMHEYVEVELGTP